MIPIGCARRGFCARAARHRDTDRTGIRDGRHRSPVRQNRQSSGKLRPMQIWGIAVVRDEADIIELTVRHMCGQGLDRLLVADNLSRDATRSILDRLSQELPVTVVDDRDPAHRQSEKMTTLANQAAAAGAEWIVPFDADELWRGSTGTVRAAIEATSATALVAAMFDHAPTPTARRGSIADRMPHGHIIGWTKIAFRWQPGAVIGMGNHEVEGVATEPVSGILVVDHYPYRSFAQFRRKIRQGAAAVDVAGAPPQICFHWRAAARRPDWQLRFAWWAKRLRLRKLDGIGNAR